MKKQLLLTAAIVVLVATFGFTQTTKYTIVDLGTLGGTRSNGWFVNEAGQVIGNSQIAGDTAQHGFLWDGGTMHDLGTLGGNYSNAQGINGKGNICGGMLLGSGGCFSAGKRRQIHFGRIHGRDSREPEL